MKMSSATVQNHYSSWVILMIIIVKERRWDIKRIIEHFIMYYILLLASLNQLHMFKWLMATKTSEINLKGLGSKLNKNNSWEDLLLGKTIFLSSYPLSIANKFDPLIYLFMRCSDTVFVWETGGQFSNAVLRGPCDPRDRTWYLTYKVCTPTLNSPSYFGSLN